MKVTSSALASTAPWTTREPRSRVAAASSLTPARFRRSRLSHIPCSVRARQLDSLVASFFEPPYCSFPSLLAPTESTGRDSHRGRRVVMSHHYLAAATASRSTQCFRRWASARPERFGVASKTYATRVPSAMRMAGSTAPHIVAFRLAHCACSDN